MTPEEFRMVMDAIGKVINAAIGNLVGELQQLNADKDVGGATQLLCRGATLCVVAHVFDLLLAATNSARRIQLPRLATISRIVLDQRREERHTQAAGPKRRGSSSRAARSDPEARQWAGLVQEVYGMSAASDDTPADETPPEPPSAPSAADVADESPLPQPGAG